MREYLNDVKRRYMMKEFNGYFESIVDIPLLRQVRDRKLRLWL